MDVNREIEVSGDRLKREIPSPKGRVKPLFPTSKFLSDQVIEGGKYELKRILEAQRDKKGEWKFFETWRFPAQNIITNCSQCEVPRRTAAGMEPVQIDHATVNFPGCKAPPSEAPIA